MYGMCICMSVWLFQGCHVHGKYLKMFGWKKENQDLESAWIYWAVKRSLKVLGFSLLESQILWIFTCIYTSVIEMSCGHARQDFSISIRGRHNCNAFTNLVSFICSNPHAACFGKIPHVAQYWGLASLRTWDLRMLALPCDTFDELLIMCMLICTKIKQ